MSIVNVVTAIDAFAKGGFVIIVDDEARENEGDLAIAAEFVTAQHINFCVTEGRGLVCCALDGKIIDDFELPLMVPEAQNKSGFGTGFTVSVEAAHGVSTGISAADRAHTVQVLINPASQPADIVSPGHMFPLRARSGGLFARDGQTEASVDLAKLARCRPGAVICEIMNQDGTMARMPDLAIFAKKHALPIVSVAAIKKYLHDHYKDLVQESIIEKNEHVCETA